MSGPGAAINRNILLVTERDDFQKDLCLMRAVETELSQTGYQIVFYRDRRDLDTVSLLDPGGALAKKSLWVRRTVKAARLLRHPSRYGYFLNWCADQRSIDARCRKLRAFVRRLGSDKNIVILSRSAGGLIASRVADDAGIRKMICLGYPFKHPLREQEPHRVEHLATLKTRFLIVQGIRDAYGGIDSRTEYQLSPQVSLVFADTDHDFAICPQEWDRVIGQIKKFIAS